MRRSLLICGLVAAAIGLWSAEPAPPVAAEAPATSPGYGFTVGAPGRLYAYSVKQSAAWSSAGDQLTYTSTLTWKFVLTVVEATQERAVLEATILRVQATHDGPGSRRLVDSGAKDKELDGGDDPLLGHLLALHGAVLSVVVAPGTGQVSEVRGGDAIIARINKRAPALTPGDTPPLDAAARAAFSSESLARIWSQLLALPGAPARIPLGPPLTGEVERAWQGDAYTLRLPAGADRLEATLVGDPTPVAVVLSELTGTGTATVVDGMPATRSGRLDYTLTFQALTQPVVQRHTLAWELTPLDRAKAEAR